MKKILLTVSLLLSTILVDARITENASTVPNARGLAATNLPPDDSDLDDDIDDSVDPAPKDPVKKAEEKAQQAKEKALEEAEKAFNAIQTAERTRRSADLGIAPEIDIINKTGRAVSVYGMSSGSATPKLLATFQISKPAQTVTIPAGIQAIYVETTGQSNTLSLVHGIQAVTITTESSIGQYTYDVSPLIPSYGDHVLVYNATDTPQSIQLQLHTTTPGIILSTNKDHNFAYQVPADTTSIITIPKFASPTTQAKKATFGLKESHQEITTDAHNSFVVTVDNGLATLHKI